MRGRRWPPNTQPRLCRCGGRSHTRTTRRMHDATKWLIVICGIANEGRSIVDHSPLHDRRPKLSILGTVRGGFLGRFTCIGSFKGNLYCRGFGDAVIQRLLLTTFWFFVLLMSVAYYVFHARLGNTPHAHPLLQHAASRVPPPPPQPRRYNATCTLPTHARRRYRSQLHMRAIYNVHAPATFVVGAGFWHTHCHPCRRPTTTAATHRAYSPTTTAT